MHTQIDWVAFSFIVGQGGQREQGFTWEDVQASAARLLPEKITSWLEGDDWEIGKGRAPYSQSVKSLSRGVVLYWNGRLDHALIEVTGQGMKNIRDMSLESELLRAVQERVTRLDICSDIETDCTPEEFVGAGFSERIKSVGRVSSPTGETEYVGSRTSERFARVYRYAEPHPRSHLLRIEHELKKDYAREMVKYLLAYDVLWCQASIGKAMGWLHPLWQPGDQQAYSIKVPRDDRTLAKTELWLRSQAAPAFLKLCAEGIIEDPEEWLRSVFLKPIDDERRNQLRLL